MKKAIVKKDKINGVFDVIYPSGTKKWYYTKGEANDVAKKFNERFGNGSQISHPIYGAGKCIGYVQGKAWRIEFESGDVRDFLPEKIEQYKTQ